MQFLSFLSFTATSNVPEGAKVGIAPAAAAGAPPPPPLDQEEDNHG